MKNAVLGISLHFIHIEMDVVAIANWKLVSGVECGGKACVR